MFQEEFEPTSHKMQCVSQKIFVIFSPVWSSDKVEIFRYSPKCLRTNVGIITQTDECIVPNPHILTCFVYHLMEFDTAMNVAMDWAPRPLHFREIDRLPDWGFCGFPQSLQKIFRLNTSNWARSFPFIKKNSVAFSPQANYTDRETTACRRS
jgi:hypothetical protein